MICSGKNARKKPFSCSLTYVRYIVFLNIVFVSEIFTNDINCKHNCLTACVKISWKKKYYLYVKEIFFLSLLLLLLLLLFCNFVLFRVGSFNLRKKKVFRVLVLQQRIPGVLRTHREIFPGEPSFRSQMDIVCFKQTFFQIQNLKFTFIYFKFIYFILNCSCMDSQNLFYHIQYNSAHFEIKKWLVVNIPNSEIQIYFLYLISSLTVGEYSSTLDIFYQTYW